MNKIYIFCPKYYVKYLTKDQIDKYANMVFVKDDNKEYEYDIMAGKSTANDSDLLKKLEDDKDKDNKVVFIKINIIDKSIVHAAFSYNKLDKKIAHLRSKLSK